MRDSLAGKTPEVSTRVSGQTYVIEITNAELALVNVDGFLQNNPLPGIESVSAT